MNLVDPELERTDPNPCIYEHFNLFNMLFFNDKLGSCEVKWSKRMTICAGICRYKPRLGECVVALSEPLLKLRPRKDLIETLLHECIHAYLFLTNGNTDRDGHGPSFQYHMNRINSIAGTNISIYHSFHDEVRHYKTHVWLCNGVCRTQRPYFGFVKRSMNRSPGPSDKWYETHRINCGGTFSKVKEPEEFTRKNKEKEKKLEANQSKKREVEQSKNKLEIVGGVLMKKEVKPKIKKKAAIKTTTGSLDKFLSKSPTIIKNTSTGASILKNRLTDGLILRLSAPIKPELIVIDD
uniref:SprT-like domain-containing protein n=1 Tax=Rhabditophanes sp. KR3021 TaxID=114890 RepID=A0AC35TN42_9BILA